MNGQVQPFAIDIDTVICRILRCRKQIRRNCLRSFEPAARGHAQRNDLDRLRLIRMEKSSTVRFVKRRDTRRQRIVVKV